MNKHRSITLAAQEERAGASRTQYGLRIPRILFPRLAGGMPGRLKVEMGPSVPAPAAPTGQLDLEGRAAIVSEVVSELDAEYPPMDSSFDYVTARRAAYLAIDKLLSRPDVIIQPDARGEA